MLNNDFSQEHADAQHEGKESENNRYHDWEDEFDILSKVNNVETTRYGIYNLVGNLPDDKEFSYQIDNMLIFQLEDQESKITQLAFSEQIIDSYMLDRDAGKLQVYIREDEPHSNPIPGIYIASHSFPKELID